MVKTKYEKKKKNIDHQYLYILRGFRKLIIAFFFLVKNTPKLIN